jgi:hypothetical protein
MASAFVTNGIFEANFISSLLTSNVGGARAALSSFNNNTNSSSHALPGTSASMPDNADLDAFGFLIELLKAIEFFPPVFAITVGGCTVPESSLSLSADHRFLGTANSSIFTHVPKANYVEVMSYLDAQLPSEHINQASATQRRTIPITVFFAACTKAHVESLVFTCYGLKDPLEILDPPSVKLPAHLMWLENCVSASSCCRIDIGIEYHAEGRTFLVGRPGSAQPPGIQRFPICSLLQGVTSLMRHMKANPFDEQCALFVERQSGGGNWSTGNAKVGADFFRAVGAPFRITQVKGATESTRAYKYGIFSDTPPDGDVSGVVSTSLYNCHQRHNGLAVEPSRHYQELGVLRSGGGGEGGGRRGRSTGTAVPLPMVPPWSLPEDEKETEDEGSP